MKVLVVGGRGFIGRALVAHLAARGHAALALGRGEPAPEATFDALVFAQGHRDGAPEDLMAAHVATTRALLARYAPAQALYLGSGEVYPRDAPLPFTEPTPPAPATPYGHAKLAAERLLGSYSDTGARALVLRLGVVYGPGQRGPMLLPSLLDSLLHFRDFPMTSGTQTRDLVFVDDLADLVTRILETPLETALPPVLNAASGRETSVRDLALRVAAMMSGHLGRDLTPHLRFGALAPRPADHPRYALDPTLTRATLGWTATTALDEGLARAVAAALTQR